MLTRREMLATSASATALAITPISVRVGVSIASTEWTPALVAIRAVQHIAKAAK